MHKASLLFDPNSKKGEDFIQKVKNLTGIGVKYRKTFNKEELVSHDYLLQFFQFNDPELKTFYDSLELTQLFVGTFGRKNGYCHYPPKENIFLRCIVHIGSPEVYYISSNNFRDKAIAMLNGYVYSISFSEIQETRVTVYSNPIRMIADKKVAQEISKLRPANYSRTVLIYDFSLKEKFNKNLNVTENEKESLN